MSSDRQKQLERLTELLPSQDREVVNTIIKFADMPRELCVRAARLALMLNKTADEFELAVKTLHEIREPIRKHLVDMGLGIGHNPGDLEPVFGRWDTGQLAKLMVKFGLIKLDDPLLQDIKLG